MNTINEKAEKPFIWYFSITTGIFLILVKLFRWELIEFLSVFIEPLLELLLFALFIVALIWSFFHLIRNYKKNLKPAIITFAINLIVLMLVMIVPFTRIYMEMNFMLNFNQRVKVVDMIQSGELAPASTNDLNTIKLPKQYQYLSKGYGEVYVIKEGDKLTVFFYTFHGILDNFAGFTYVSDDKMTTDEFFSEIFELQKMRDNWYWASSR